MFLFTTALSPVCFPLALKKKTTWTDNNNINCKKRTKQI